MRACTRHFVFDAARAGGLALEQAGGQRGHDGHDDQGADDGGAAFAGLGRVHGSSRMRL